MRDDVFRQDGIGVEKKNILAFRVFQRLIASMRKPCILCVDQKPNARKQWPEEFDAAVGRMIVNDDKLRIHP